jgi:MFS family permease
MCSTVATWWNIIVALVTRLGSALGATFSSLENPNYRRYFVGQALSLIGTWMQLVAQSWLVLTMTGSSVAVGVVVALQTAPVLLLAPYGGVVADRVDKRKLLVGLQASMALQALALGLLTVFGVIRFWEICALALLLGLHSSFEVPTRQSFLLEMVGRDSIRNAVSLNSVIVNAARAIGPAIAGVLIAVVGEGVCFLINCGTFVAVIVALLLMDVSLLRPSEPALRARGQLREGLRYVRRTPELAVPLVMMGLIGTLTYEFPVSLPVLAKRSFDLGSAGFGFMTAAMGVGAALGGLVTAARGRTGLRAAVIAAAAFGVCVAAAAAAPTVALELAALVLVGAGSVSFVSVGNSTLQLGADPSMRGRVMSLWSVAFQGSTAIGGPIIGGVIALTDARVGLAVGAVTCFVAAAIGATVLRRPALQRA